MSRRERQIAEASETFAKHVIAERGDGRWLMMRPEGDGTGRFTREFAVEVVLLWDGYLYVGGDIEHVVFG